MPNQHNFAKRRSCSRFQSLTDIDRPGGGGNGNANQGISKERKKLDHVKKLILFSETKKLTI